MIDWSQFSKKSIDDGKFNSPTPSVSFPGYIDNISHPFQTIFYESSNNSNILQWMHTDTEEAYLNNLHTMPADWRYRTKRVEYRLNSSGYRTHEWNDVDWKNSIVLLGCSNTFGIGLNEDETYAYMLGKLLGRPVVNLGVPAGSASTVLANSSTLVCKFQMPYAVVINWPPLPRLRYYTQDTFCEIGHWIKENDRLNDIDLFSLYFNMFADESNTLAYSYYISQATRAMFENRTNYITFSYIEPSAHYTRADIYIPMNRTAREGIHPGIENSKQVTSYIIARLK